MKAKNPPELKNRRRAFGQNFLVDASVIDTLIEDTAVHKGDWVIEIGPGNGALTRRLAAVGARVTAVEIDPACVEKISRSQAFSAVECRLADASRLSLSDLPDPRENPERKPIVVGNLPYNRAAAILRNVLPDLQSFHHMYFMFQYEVAKRLAALPGVRDYGGLSVFARSFSNPTLVRKISRDAFRPRPNVFSATVRFDPLVNHPTRPDPLFFAFVNSCFALKRKKLINALSSRGYAKTQLREALARLGLPEEIRAEQMTVEQFQSLFLKLKEARSYSGSEPSR